MKVKDRPGFTVYPTRNTSAPKLRVCWREGNGKQQRNRVVDSIEEAKDLIDSLAPTALTQRIADSKIAPQRFSLFEYLVEYPNRMARERRHKKSPHIKRTIHYLKKFFLMMKFQYLDDISPEKLDKYVAESTDSRTTIADMVRCK